MDRNDILVLAGIITGTSVLVSLMYLVQSGVISNPFLKI